MLEAGDFRQTQQMLRPDGLLDPFASRHSEASLAHAASSLPPLARVLASLFTLNAAVAADEVVAAMGERSTERLLEAGLLGPADETRLRSPFVAVSWLGLVLLASPPLWWREYRRDQPVVYVGPDSYTAARFVASAPPAARALDLGTGAGLLAAVAPGRSVAAVEVDPAAAELARFNMALNGIADRVDVVEGDLYEPVAGEAFDLITCNPPFLPAPDSLHLPLCGDGGEDGGKVLRRALAGVGEALASEGRAIVYGEDFGDDGGPAIADWLADRYADTGLHATVFVCGAQSLESAGISLRGLWQVGGATEDEAFAAWSSFCDSHPSSVHYSFVIEVRPAAKGGASIRRLANR
jgi:hypothetical protein